MLSYDAGMLRCSVVIYMITERCNIGGWCDAISWLHGKQPFDLTVIHLFRSTLFLCIPKARGTSTSITAVPDSIALEVSTCRRCACVLKYVCCYCCASFVPPCVFGRHSAPPRHQCFQNHFVFLFLFGNRFILDLFGCASFFFFRLCLSCFF